MFCAGNNTERMRMASVNCVNEIIVDLYAGLFSLISFNTSNLTSYH